MKRKILCVFVCALMLMGCHKTTADKKSRDHDSDEIELTTTTESTFNYGEMLDKKNPEPSDDVSKSVTYNEDRNPEEVKIYDDGKLIEQYSYHKGDCSQETQTKYYYENDLLVKEELLYNGSSLGYTTYQYDDHGLLTSKEEYDEEGVLTFSDEFMYDELGFIKETMFIDGCTIITMTAPNGDITSRDEYNEDGKQTKQITYEYEYDNQGNCLRKSTYNYGVLTDEEIREYDDFHNVIKKSDYSDGELIREMIVEYSEDYSQATFDFIGYYGNEEGQSTSYFLKKFDENGRMIENHWYDGGKESDNIQITYYTYDQNGNLLSEEFGNQKNIYEYDREGNLIAETIYIDGEVRSATTYDYDYK